MTKVLPSDRLFVPTIDKIVFVPTARLQRVNRSACVGANFCMHFISLQKLQITKQTALTSVRINDRGKPMMTGDGRINGKPPCQAAMTR